MTPRPRTNSFVPCPHGRALHSLRVFVLAMAAAIAVVSVAVAAPKAKKAEPMGPGSKDPHSADWGPDYQKRLQAVFDKLLRHSGYDNNLQAESRSPTRLIYKGEFRSIEGSPAVALAARTGPNEGNDFSIVAVGFGIFEICRNEDELAFILGHEIAHLSMGHLEKLKDFKLELANKWMDRVLKEEKKKKSKTSLFDDEKKALAAFEREHKPQIEARIRSTEVEADREGMNLARLSGFKPEAAAESMRHGQDWMWATYAGKDTTHDPIQARIAELHRMAALARKTEEKFEDKDGKTAASGLKSVGEGLQAKGADQEALNRQLFDKESRQRNQLGHAQSGSASGKGGAVLRGGEVGGAGGTKLVDLAQSKYSRAATAPPAPGAAAKKEKIDPNSPDAWDKQLRPVMIERYKKNPVANQFAVPVLKDEKSKITIRMADLRSKEDVKNGMEGSIASLDYGKKQLNLNLHTVNKDIQETNVLRKKKGLPPVPLIKEGQLMTKEQKDHVAERFMPTVVHELTHARNDQDLEAKLHQPAPYTKETEVAAFKLTAMTVAAERQTNPNYYKDKTFMAGEYNYIVSAYEEEKRTGNPRTFVDFVDGWDGYKALPQATDPIAVKNMKEGAAALEKTENDCRKKFKSKRCQEVLDSIEVSLAGTQRTEFSDARKKGSEATLTTLAYYHKTVDDVVKPMPVMNDYYKQEYKQIASADQKYISVKPPATLVMEEIRITAGKPAQKSISSSFDDVTAAARTEGP